MALRFSILGFLQVLLVFSQINLYAQSVSNYGVSEASSSYSYNAGTQLSGDYANNIPIGFDFWYMGKRYATVSASIKGWVSLGGVLTQSLPSNDLKDGGVRPVLAPLWDDIERIPGILFLINPGRFSHHSTGTVGQRKFMLQWNLMRWDRLAPTTLTIGGDVISFQLVLNEANGNVEFLYRSESQPVNSGSASVGITASGTGAGNFLSVNSISATSITSSTATETSSIDAKASGSRGILFNPQETNAPSNLTFSAVGTTGMKLNWMDNSTDELGFVVYRSTNNSSTATYTYITTTAANAISYNDTGLTAGTTYYYRVYALRENLSTAAVGSQATLTNCTSFNSLQVSSNGPVCVGTNLNLIASTIPDATYAWTGPNGFTSNLQNPSVVYSLLRAGTYTLTVSRNGCTNVASINVFSDGRPGLWEGGASTDWNLANNWCDGLLPQATTDVTIPSGKPRYPLVSSAAASANNISISNSATLTVDNQNLTIRGAINNSGIFNVANGSITFSNTASAQVIPANVFQGNVIKNLTVTNTFGLTLNGPLRVNGTLNVTSGFLNANNDFLTLGASTTSSAIVSPLTSSTYITGRVKVETFVAGGAIDPFRTYRMLSSPVYDNNESLVLTNVEGNRSAKFSQLIDDMILSGSTGPAGGFDATPVNQASVWTYNGGYIPVTNINTPVNAGQGMYVFFRGDRSNFTGKTIPPFAPVENTIVDYDGFLNQRDITVSLSHVTNGRFNLLGNPYASPIDWDSGSFTKTNLNNAIWVWKPSSRSYATYISGVGQNGGVRYIAPGQSFFVRSSGASPSITFREGVKSTVPNTGMQLLSSGKVMAASSRTQQLLNNLEETGNTPVELSILRVGIKSVASFGEDEAVIVFKDGADAQWTDEDAVHFDGEQINLSSLSPNGRKLAINFMPRVNALTEIPLSVTASATGNYLMNFDLSGYSEQSLTLKDSYLNTLHPIANSKTHQFYINTADAATSGNTRFSLIIDKPAVLPLDQKYFSAKIQDHVVEISWNAGGDISNNLFRLYRAGANGQFSWLADIPGKAVDHYLFVDKNPLLGVNYYKLEIQNAKGGIEDKGVVVLMFGLAQDQTVSIYPNPAIDRITLQYQNLYPGENNIEVFDLTGKVLYRHLVSSNRFITTSSFDISKLSAGVYVLKITSGQQIIGHSRFLKL